QHLAQNADLVVRERDRGAEALIRVPVGGPQQQPVEGHIPLEQRFLLRGGKLGVIGALVDGQVHDQRRQLPPHRVDVTSHGRPGAGDLARLEALGAEDVPVRPDAADRAEVDELDLVFGDDDVVGLEVVVDHPAGVQVVQGGQNLQHVANGDVHRQRVVGGFAAPFAQGGPAHELHDDESAGGAGIVDEVENLHDAGVSDVREEGAFGVGDGAFVLVLGRHQALEDDVAVRDVVVGRDVDPSQAAVGDGAQDVVLSCDEVPGLQRGRVDALRDRVAGVNDRFFGDGGCDERQVDHAVGDVLALARRATQRAEGGERLPAGAFPGVDLDGVGGRSAGTAADLRGGGGDVSLAASLGGAAGRSEERRVG